MNVKEGKTSEPPPSGRRQGPDPRPQIKPVPYPDQFPYLNLKVLLVFHSCLVVLLAYLSKSSAFSSLHTATPNPQPESQDTMLRAPAIGICHGGGPLPVLNDPAHKQVVHSLQTRVPKLLKLKTPQQPKAIVLITAHWEEPVLTISNGTKHDMLYDYGGFPREAYSIKHNAPGSPEIAQLIATTLAKAGIKSEMDPERGWDHGVFVPLKVINPATDIPVIQTSVLSSQSPSDLYKLGQALQPLRDQNIAIIGSGSASYHNLRGWFTGGTMTPAFKDRHSAWAAAMDDAMLTNDSGERGTKLKDWRKWPNASSMHPPGAAEHLSPLIVCAGAGGDQVAESWSDELLGVDMKSYAWT